MSRSVKMRIAAYYTPRGSSLRFLGALFSTFIILLSQPARATETGLPAAAFATMFNQCWPKWDVVPELVTEPAAGQNGLSSPCAVMMMKAITWP